MQLIKIQINFSTTCWATVNVFIFHLIFFRQNSCFQCFAENYFTFHSLSNKTKPQLRDSLIQTELIYLLCPDKTDFPRISCLCPHLRECSTQPHSFKAEHSSCVWEKLLSWVCCFWGTETTLFHQHSSPSSHTLHTCQAATSFHTCFVQAGINTYWFCTCTKTQKLWCWGEWEKSLCAILCHLSNSTQHEGDDALLYTNNHLVCYFALPTLKSLTLSPKCHCCPPFRCCSSTINKWQEISWWKQLNILLRDFFFFLAIWVWEKSQRVLGEMQFASEFSCTKTAVSSVCTTHCMHTQKGLFISTYNVELCVKGQDEDLPCRLR